MQAINAAYRLIGARSGMGQTVRVSQTADHGSRGSLTPQQVQEIVDGINATVRPTIRLTASHIVSALLTAGALLTQWAKRDGSAAVGILIGASLPLACIWFTAGVGWALTAKFDNPRSRSSPPEWSVFVDGCC